MYRVSAQSVDERMVNVHYYYYYYYVHETKRFIQAVVIFMSTAAPPCQAKGCSPDAKCAVHQGMATCLCPLGKSGEKCTTGECFVPRAPFGQRKYIALWV